MLLLYLFRFLRDVQCFGNVFFLFWVILPDWFCLQFGLGVAFLSCSCACHVFIALLLRLELVAFLSPPVLSWVNVCFFFLFPHLQISCLNWDQITSHLICSVKPLLSFMLIFFWASFNLLNHPFPHCSAMLATLSINQVAIHAGSVSMFSLFSAIDLWQPCLTCLHTVIGTTASGKLLITCGINLASFFSSYKVFWPFVSPNQLVKILSRFLLITVNL